MSIKAFNVGGTVQRYDYDALDNKPTIPAAVTVDDTLTTQGAAADAKATGDAIAAISGGGGSGLTDEIKEALLAIVAKAVYIDDGGPTYYQDLYDALYPESE